MNQKQEFIKETKELLGLEEEETPKQFTIYHKCSGKLSFKNRLRVLWNGSIQMDSSIVVDKEVNIISSKAGIITSKIFVKKQKPLVDKTNLT